MEFNDTVVENIKLFIDDTKEVDTNNVIKMIVKYLCGEKYYKSSLDKKDEQILRDLLSEEVHKFNDTFFNELLLLLDQDRVSKDFFDFFIKSNKAETSILDILKNGVIKFRGYSLLCFGNFRFAYKKLYTEKRKTN